MTDIAARLNKRAAMAANSPEWDNANVNNSDCYCGNGRQCKRAETLSIAHCIIQRLQGASAVTLAGGYAIVGSARVLFPAGTVCKENRSAAGRCTRFECEYSDGSRIAYTWSELTGPRYNAQVAA